MEESKQNLHLVKSIHFNETTIKRESNDSNSMIKLGLNNNESNNNIKSIPRLTHPIISKPIKNDNLLSLLNKASSFWKSHVFSSEKKFR